MTNRQEFGLELFKLEGRTALITGASQGIGYSIAEHFSYVGADVILLAKEDISVLESAAQSICAPGRKTWAFPGDLLDCEAIPSMYETILSDCHTIDILVNCAGTTVRETAESLKLEDWDRVIRLNLTAVFVLSQAFAKERIRQNKPGRIINIASLMSEAARPGTSAYAASKGGIRQLTKALAVDWAKYGITVNAIGPGYIRTPFTDVLASDEQFDAWVRTRTPLGRWGMPEDVARAAVFLASDAASFITGQILYVDGGWLSTF